LLIFGYKKITMAEIKKLVKGERKIFGVCSGLANYFDIDPTIMRLLFVVAFLGFGAGLLIYVVMAVIMPDK
jgi:phage shock protein C